MLLTAVLATLVVLQMVVVWLLLVESQVLRAELRLME
jgi:hypothetical protein